MKPSLAIKKENVDLEKQVSKLNNFTQVKSSIKFMLLIAFTSIAINAQAQERLTIENGKSYVLKKVNVTGKVTYNEQTIVTFAGLSKGQTITVPGEEISNSIKKLWKLGLYNNVNFYVDKIEGDSISLELNLNELPKLNEIKVVGVKKSARESLIKDNELTAEKIVNENLLTTTKYYIENKYKKEGYFNTKVNITTIEDTATVNHVNMVINIDRGKKVRIKDIELIGNNELKKGVLLRSMKDTRHLSLMNFLKFKSMKFKKDKYKDDLSLLIDKYKENGYRDARIKSDTVVYDSKTNKVKIKINLEEGKKYYFGDINFTGNTIYNDQLLSKYLGIKKGDVYNSILLDKRIADKTQPDGEDITNLYQNNGYLFSNINPVEVRTDNNQIDLDIRIVEGPLAHFNKISVVGNDKTNDKVIYRELRTKPGEVYSKENLVRTIREIGQLGFFDAEAIKPDFENVDPAGGTVDIKYHVAEKGASQIELQGGYGGGGFIGTLGLSFNNFALSNIFKKNAYKPLPMGDGQKLSLRLQASSYFQTYSFSFAEPWFGGKKPIQFSGSLSYSKQFSNNFTNNSVDRSKNFNIFTVSLGIAKRLQFPDDYFVLSQSVSYQHYDLNNYNIGLFTFGNGTSRNLSYTIGLTRNNKGVNPIFPTYGSEFSMIAKLTPPYSYFNGVDYQNLGNLAENKLYATNSTETYNVGDPLINNNGVLSKANSIEEASPDPAKIDQKKFNWLEYYKIKVKAEWFSKIYEKLTLRTLGEFGFMGAYDNKRGLVPFERFYLGGDGLANFAMDGRETIQLRGYPNNSLTPTITQGERAGQQIGGTAFNKFSLELRYPITLKQTASIYMMAFVEGGAAFEGFKSYNPFAIKRSAGVGLRVFMPAFGLLGIDFAHGFDSINPGGPKSGWQTHFIIGQQF
ncbi:outer membrane protein assembly factor BamA [Flavobacterium columnare]|uniref:Outer membrane protein assembly factor BamA n=1 Tax=Flavobacterium columnare TaxID=996 RepID=A0AAI8CGM7_9FLAO|nr:outer membrane protein assembly factor BamA [Flavobacterium columnare]AMO20807.1 outer membrane protein assembly factor BamA [Flavobacterium columnare]AUX18801.1 outer membrane protein assembly factor BamA [Flavobacterium columnare]QOG57884.1 outer membrane protein assembly factor BamA [Flavobacterium columnare]QOG60607.1 outer membrane protein assembly factor BamA [Flavobacterium columnare]QOG63326.1 outer membrane protein assembly factor BamA [Flavobacterium columnare]